MSVIEIIIEHFYVLVVEYSVPIQHIFLPLSFIGYFTTGVVEHAFAFHPVFDPFSTVLTTFFVVECSESVAVLAQLVSLVSAFR
jgi:hypothetical protein